MKQFIKYFLIILLLSQYSLGVTKEYYQDKYDTTKKLYAGSILSNNKKDEIKYLRDLIRYADKLGLNTLKYQKELNRIDTTTILENKVQTVSYFKPKHTIQSVIQDENSITINFYSNIDKSYVKFSERKNDKYFFDEFDFKGNFKDAKPTKLSIKGVEKIVIYQRDEDTLRISLKSKVNLKTIYIVQNNSIIIRVLDLEKQPTPKKANEVQMVPNNTIYMAQKTIVIDPGHGGKDPGAVGTGKNYEKTIVLNIAKYIKQDLEKNGYKVYLTRDRDKFIKLSDRTKYANQKNADIFVSLHANAVAKSNAKNVYGIETYFLSPARSERAKRVAALENQGEMDDMSWGSKNSFLTILNQSKITASNKLAIDIQRNMLYQLWNVYGKKAINDHGVREGPFWVLVGAQMPSVLIEVGYLSHPEESERIKTKKYQEKIAKGIADGIKSYFKKNN